MMACGRDGRDENTERLEVGNLHYITTKTNYAMSEGLMRLGQVHRAERKSVPKGVRFVVDIVKRETGIPISLLTHIGQMDLCPICPMACKNTGCK